MRRGLGRRAVSGGPGGFTFLSACSQVSLMEGRRCRGERTMRDAARDAEKDAVAGTKVSLLWFGVGSAQRSRGGRGGGAGALT